MRDFDDKNRSISLARMTVFMGLIMAGILVTVLALNEGDSAGTRHTAGQQPNKITDLGEDTNAPPAPEQPGGTFTYSGDDRTSDELDIWDEDYAEILRVTPTSPPVQSGSGAQADRYK